jgi:hypothetical protein
MPPQDYIAEAKALLDENFAGQVPYEQAEQGVERAKAVLLMDIAYTLSDISQDLKAIATKMAG